MTELNFLFQIFALLIGYNLTRNCAAHNSSDDVIQNFQKFSLNLFSLTDFDDISFHAGAATFSPFGVGYMLANINSKVWNVSSSGFERFLNVPLEQISDQYASLIEKLKQADIRSSNAVYIDERNVTVILPEESQKLNTSLNYIDTDDDWYNSWHLMNGMVSNTTEGTLNDSLVPTGGFYGHPFWPFAVGAFINTNYFKSAWAQRWDEIGHKNFSDGFSVPFYQVEGIYPTYETEDFTAVALQLSEKRKFGVFVHVKQSSRKRFFQDELPSLLIKGESWMNPALWLMSKKKIQVPRLNFTLLSQYYMGFENFGINNTFCPWDYIEDPDAANRQQDEEYEYWVSRKPFFAHPIAQANYILFSPDFLELASATGMIANSMKKLFEFYRPEGNKTDDNNGTDESEDPSPLSTSSKLSYDMKGVNSSEDTLVFDQPFFWYLHDSELGSIQYGLVRSFAAYKKSYDDILNDPDFGWLHGVRQYLMWTCPYKYKINFEF